MEAFSGTSRCMTTEKFLGAYQEQACYANCGDVVQKSSQFSEFEVILTCSTNQISNKLSSSNKTFFWRNHYGKDNRKPSFFGNLFFESSMRVPEV